MVSLFPSRFSSFVPRYRAAVSVHSCEAKTPRKVRKKGIKLTRGCRKHVVRGSELILYARAINAPSPQTKIQDDDPRASMKKIAHGQLFSLSPFHPSPEWRNRHGFDSFSQGVESISSTGWLSF